MNDNSNISMVPDGNWGWIIVAAVAWINMTNQSITSVFGLLFAKQLHNIDGHNTITPALIANLNSSALNFSGFVVGPAIKSFKPRNVAITGCLLVSTGLFICCFSTQIWHFIMGYSIFVGFGLGLIAPSTFMTINEYFSAKRGRAVGVSLAGSGLGQIILPHFASWCLEYYGFRIALMTMSAISLTGVFGAILLKPLTRPNVKEQNIQHIKPLLLHSELRSKSISSETQPAVEQKKSWWQLSVQRLVQAMDLELLSDPIFLSIIIGMALVYTSTVNFTMLFPGFLQNAAQLSNKWTANCMSIVAAADITSRLLLPCITDKLKLPYRVIFLGGSFGLVLARSVLAESTSLSGIIASSIFIGMCKSATVVNNNLVIAAHCRKHKLAGGLGLNMIAKGILVIILGLVLGWIRDMTHSYVWGLHAQNLLIILVILLWTPEVCYNYIKKRRSAQKVAGNLETA